MVKIGDNVNLGEFPLLLAPMEDVSDPPFRALCKEQGCDMMYTEFISVEGLIRDATKSVQKLDIYDYLCLMLLLIHIWVKYTDVMEVLAKLSKIMKTKENVFSLVWFGFSRRR